jgi:hypothetical protein
MLCRLKTLSAWKETCAATSILLKASETSQKLSLNKRRRNVDQSPAQSRPIKRVANAEAATTASISNEARAASIATKKTNVNAETNNESSDRPPAATRESNHSN